MAEVFLGTSTRKEFESEFIAIKKLHQNLNQNKPFVNLLIHEAKIGVLLNHPSIATVYDLGSHQQEFFLAMEYVHGKSLDHVLDKIQEGKAPPLGLELSTYITMETLRALSFAHQLKDRKGRDLNIIHRDVSPGNLLLEYKGNVKLSDFGIATAESRLQVEFSSSAMGKMKYMPPEQAVNDPVVQSSDLYSMAVVYFQLASGRLPYESETPSSLYREIVEGRVTDSNSGRTEFPPELESIVMKALNRSAKKRFATATEFFECIRDYFLKKENTDFNSRTVRAYYRKKLAEYLRRHFESEIIEELDIIQWALQYHDDQKSLKQTAPQQVPADLADDLDSVSEATQFQPDHTDEATRHYPLTEKERESIIKGLPPKEAMAPIAGSSMHDAEGFEFATVPEHDVDWTKQKSEIKDVDTKLQRVSLSRDQKEQLNDSKPSVQIQTENDLEEFESSMLTPAEHTIMLPMEDEMAPPDFENASTKEQSAPNDLQGVSLSSKGQMPMDEFLQDENALDEASDQTIELNTKMLEETEKVPLRPNFQLPKIKLPKMNFQFLKTLRTKLKALWPAKPRRLFLSLSAFVFASGLIYFLAIAAFEVFDLKSIFREQAALLPTHQISLVFLGDTDLRSQRRFQDQLTEGESAGLKQIQNFYQQEYKRYVPDSDPKKPLLTLVPHLPELAPQSLVDRLVQGNFSQAMSHLAKEGFRHKSAADATIFIYLRDREPSQYFWIPGQDLSKRTHKQAGIVVHNIKSGDNTAFLVELARQIAFVHGALNKTDLETKLPRVPVGLADPEREPIFPQEKAELMGKEILIDLFHTKPVDSLEQLVIGKETAYELGWIKANQK